MRAFRLRFIVCALLSALPLVGVAESKAPQTVSVIALDKAPVLDGKVADWPKNGWVKIKVTPAVPKDEREKYGLDPEDRNVTGDLTLDLLAGVVGDRIYLAARWPDDSEDVEFKGWRWLGSRYVEGKKREDNFAVRFHLADDYDRSMLSEKTYAVDLWFWSAARTNPLGLAEDWTHHFTTQMVDNAAEYEVKGVGTVYIRKVRDDGEPIYKMIPRPRRKVEAQMPSFELNNKPSGSVADVQAKGRWEKKYWALEFSRKLNTGHPDDVVFRPGVKVLGQVAVFNRGAEENKSVSEPLLFDFSAIR